MTEVNTHSGSKIRAARKQAGLTSTQFAALLECSHGHLTQIEGGSRPASRRFLERAAQALKVPVTELAEPEQLMTAEDRAFDAGFAAGYEAFRKELATAEALAVRHSASATTREALQLQA